MRPLPRVDSAPCRRPPRPTTPRRDRGVPGRPVAGYGVAIPVGAIAILILGLSARTSFRVGSAAALGVATADGMYAAVAALGGAAVASGLAPFAGPLRLIAAGVLLALAGLTARRALRPPAPARAAPAPAQEPPRVGLDTPVRAFAGFSR